MYQYLWVFAQKTVVYDTIGYRTFLFFYRKSPHIQRFSEQGGASILDARIFLFPGSATADFHLAPPNEKNQKVGGIIKRLPRNIKRLLLGVCGSIPPFPWERSVISIKLIQRKKPSPTQILPEKAETKASGVFYDPGSLLFMYSVVAAAVLRRITGHRF